MNFLDLILVLIIAGSVWRGFRRGFIEGFLHVVVLAISFTATLFLYPHLQSFINRFLGFSDWSFVIALIVTFLLLRVLITMLVDQLFYRDDADVEDRAQWNLILGFIPGIVEGLIYAMFMVVLCYGFPNPTVQDQVQNSKVAGKLSGPINWFDIRKN